MSIKRPRAANEAMRAEVERMRRTVRDAPGVVDEAKAREAEGAGAVRPRRAGSGTLTRCKQPQDPLANALVHDGACRAGLDMRAIRERNPAALSRAAAAWLPQQRISVAWLEESYRP